MLDTHHTGKRDKIIMRKVSIYIYLYMGWNIADIKALNSLNKESNLQLWTVQAPFTSELTVFRLIKSDGQLKMGFNTTAWLGTRWTFGHNFDDNFATLFYQIVLFLHSTEAHLKCVRYILSQTNAKMCDLVWFWSLYMYQHMQDR